MLTVGAAVQEFSGYLPSGQNPPQPQLAAWLQDLEVKFEETRKTTALAPGYVRKGAAELKGTAP